MGASLGRRAAGEYLRPFPRPGQRRGGGDHATPLRQWPTETILDVSAPKPFSVLESRPGPTFPRQPPALALAIGPRSPLPQLVSAPCPRPTLPQPCPTLRCALTCPPFHFPHFPGHRRAGTVNPSPTFFHPPPVSVRAIRALRPFPPGPVFLMKCHLDKCCKG